MELYYKKYEKALQEAGYTLLPHGAVINKLGVTVASQDRHGNVYCLDPNMIQLVANYVEPQQEQTPAEPEPQPKRRGRPPNKKALEA
jgi:hypothetical protein